MTAHIAASWRRGRLADGSSFHVPPTADFVHALLRPAAHRAAADLLVLLLAAAHIAIFIVLRPPRAYCAVVFLFWRCCYNIGLGCLLFHQSHSRALIRIARKLGLESTFNATQRRRRRASPLPVSLDNDTNTNTVDGLRNRRVISDVEHSNVSPPTNSISNDSRGWLANFLRQQVETKMRNTCPEYNYDDYPTEFNVWVLYRMLVDIILLNDFTSYVVFAAAFWNIPNSHCAFDYLRYAVGICMLLFNIWIKTDAHRVVKDYAWYWGDFFFLVDENLQFDGVFELVPHPMYSVGYIGFYAAALITASYPVLFVSLLAHAGQMLFLSFVETPHIEKTYNPPKPNDHGSSSKHYVQKFGSRDMIWLMNMDLFRATDAITLVSALGLALNAIFFVGLSRQGEILSRRDIYYAGLSWLWCTIHIIGSGIILYQESHNKNWTRHFIHQGETPKDAFNSFKGIFNFTQITSHVSFVLAVIYFMELPQNGLLNDLFPLRVTIGALFIALHTYVIFSTIEVIGSTGWFYGDFFLDELRLNSGPTYNGLYRYINNPLLFTFSSWGLSIVSGSSYIWALTVYQQLLNWLFVQCVEKPAMNILYKGQVQEAAGIERVIRGKLNQLQCWFKTKVLRQVDYQQLENDNDLILNSTGQQSTLVEGNDLLVTPNQQIANGKTDETTSDSLVLRDDDLLSPSYSDANLTKIIDEMETIASHSSHMPTVKILLTETAMQLTKLVSKIHEVSSMVPQEIRASFRLIIQRQIENRVLLPCSDATPKGTTGNLPVFMLGEPITIQFDAILEHITKRDWIGLYPVGINSNPELTAVSSAGRWLWITGEGHTVDVGDDESSTETPTGNISDLSSALLSDLDNFSIGDTIATKVGELTIANGNSNLDSLPLRKIRAKLIFSFDQLPWEQGIYEARYHHQGTHNCVSVLSPAFEVRCPEYRFTENLPSLFGANSLDSSPHDATTQEIKEAQDKFLIDLVDVVALCIGIEKGSEKNIFDADTDVLSLVKVPNKVMDASAFVRYKSLIATRIIKVIHMRYSVDFSPRVLLISGTCRNLSQRIIDAKLALRRVS